MGEVRPMEEACLVIGAICKGKDILTDEMIDINEFGPPKLVSPVFDFDFTHYYDDSMGSPLYRRFYLYERGFSPDRLPEVKIRTNEIEKKARSRHLLDVARPLNLDPGYLTLSKLILASTKDHTHRIYLSRGIFAEVTLFYRSKTYQPWPWTFPDFASNRYIPFFNQARATLLRE